MPINKSKVTKILDLDLDGIPRDMREEAKAEVMDFLKEQMLADFGEATSPVTGRAFKKLSKAYAEYKAGESSSVMPNMELTGEMLDALEVVDKGGSKLEVGWWDEEQAVKAHGHTTGHDGDPNYPVRKLIPTPDEDFRSGIMREIDAILEGYRGAE